MTPATKKLALEKLAAFHPKIGYPDKWRDYSAAVRSWQGDAFGNSVRAQLFEWHRQVERLGAAHRPRRVGHDAADHQRLLQPDLQRGRVPGGHPAAAVLRSATRIRRSTTAASAASSATRWGTASMTRAPSPTPRGVLRTWWQPEDEPAFKERTGRPLAAQYDGFEALPGLNVNGRLTLGENIGDLGGLSVAYEAYHRSLHGARGAGARRTDRRSALLPLLGAGVARPAARRGPAQAGH